MRKFQAYYHSPIGIIEIGGSPQGILSLAFSRSKKIKRLQVPSCLRECVLQLDQYFKGERRIFSVGLMPEGTDFQQKVWREVRKIPFGKTASYKEVAASIGKEKAARAVGNANRLNKISIVIPCHRVIGSDGELVGYGGGLWRKRWLIAHEQQVLEKNLREGNK